MKGKINMSTGSVSKSISNVRLTQKFSDVDIPNLSKSRYQTGLQCERALYLSCYHPNEGSAPSEMARAIQKSGEFVGELAQKIYPDGELIDELYYDKDGAINHTNDAIANGAPAIFEATFMHNNILVKCDILENNGDGTYDLIEVKSATGIKQQNITDVGVQLHVLEGAGINIRNAYLMNLNPEYDYRGGKHNLSKLFNKNDITDIAKNYAKREVKHDLKRMNRVLKNRGKEPKACIGKQCVSPIKCSYYSSCHKELPDHPITELPRISAKLMDRLQKDNIWAIKDIPEGYGLSEKQERFRRSIVNNTVEIAPSLKEDFSKLQYPLHFLDFETMQSAVPEYIGARPYQQVPFQWSDHIVESPESLDNPIHKEFLHMRKNKDPRKPFVESLLETLEVDNGHIVVYSSFEKQRLNDMAKQYPEYATRIEKVIDRLYDLEKTVRESVDHPEFKGKTSIKYVLPALVKENDYDGLAIGNGSVAMTRYRQAVSGKLEHDEAKQIFKDLKEYCGVDTMSMVKVFKALMSEKEVQKEYERKIEEKEMDLPPF